MALLANASGIHIASEFGLLIAHDKTGVFKAIPGASHLLVQGLSKEQVDSITIGQYYRVGGVQNPYGQDLHETLHSPFNLPHAQAVSKGAGLSADTVQFVQVITAP